MPAKSEGLNFSGRLIVSPLVAPKTKISSVSVTVDAPVAGNEKSETAILNGAGYYIPSNVGAMDWWSDGGSSKIPFSAETVYEVRIWINAKDDYEFSSDLYSGDNVLKSAIKVNGNNAKLIRGDAGYLLISYTFPKTGTNSTTITFASGGGTGTMASVTKTLGTNWNLPSCTYTPANEWKEFDCWKLSTGERLSPGALIIVTKDLKLTAAWKWKANTPLLREIHFTIPEPVAGEKPSNNIAITTVPANAFPQTFIDTLENGGAENWQKSSDNSAYESMSSSETFAPGMYYRSQIPSVTVLYMLLSSVLSDNDYLNKTVVQGLSDDLSFYINGERFADVTASSFLCKGEIAASSVSALTDQIYTGTELKPQPTVNFLGAALSEGTDYTVSYENNTNAGTAVVTITGTGNYKGSISKTFVIRPASLAGADVTGITAKTYTGAAQTQSPSVRVGASALKEGADYTVSYENNLNAGIAAMIISGKGNYTGSIRKTFAIGAASIAEAAVSGISAKEYTGAALTQSPIVKVGARSLQAGKDYTISYQNNVRAGTAAILLTGKGNYTGTWKGNFKIQEKAYLTLNVKAGATVPLQVKKKTSKIVVTGIASDDSIASWTSNKPKIVRVVKNGVLKAGTKTGTATITVTTVRGAKVSFKVKTQKAAVKAKKITVNKKKVTLKKGESFNLLATITPVTTPDKVTFKSVSKKIATVTSKGIIRAKKAGTTKITIKCGGKSRTVTVKVTKK